MAIHFGNDKIKEIYVGSDKIKEVYYGSEKVWGEIAAPSYMVLTNNNRIDFELGNTPITNFESTDGSTSSIVVNGQSVVKNTIKEIYFGDSYGDVTSIGTYFLAYCSNLTSVDLSPLNNVTSIGDSFLRSCLGLTSVDLSPLSNVTTIRGSFLYNCSSLTSVDLSSLSKVTSIGTLFLAYCSSLTSIDLSLLSNVTSIRDYFLYRCSGLTSIDLSSLSKVTSIGTYFLAYCSGLTSVDLSSLSKVTSIGTYFLAYCSSLTTLIMGATTPPTLGSNSFNYSNNLSLISVPCGSESAYKSATNWVAKASIIVAIQDGYWVHKDTNAVTYFGLEDPSIEDGIMGYPSWMPNCSEVKLPSGVTGFKTYNWVIEDEYGDWELTYTGFVHTKETLMTGNEVLTSVDLSNTSITSMGAFCFYGCSSLTSITLPEGVTSLGAFCFTNCTSLTSITLPEGVNSIGDGCFDNCLSLTLATVLPSTPPSLGFAAFVNVHTSFNIKVHSPYVNAYKTATNWINYASIISAI